MNQILNAIGTILIIIGFVGLAVNYLQEENPVKTESANVVGYLYPEGNNLNELSWLIEDFQDMRSCEIWGIEKSKTQEWADFNCY